MKFQNKWTDNCTLLFQSALFLYLLTSLFAASLFEFMSLFAMVSKGIRYTAYLFLVCKIVQSNYYESGHLIKCGIGILLSLFSYWITRDKQLIFLMLFLMAVMNVYFDKVLKTYLWANGTGILIVFLAYKIRLIPNRLYSNSRSRHSLGFGYPTTISNYWLYFMLAYIAYRKERLTIIELSLIHI